jgi:general secretion pathway protein N
MMDRLLLLILVAGCLLFGAVFYIELGPTGGEETAAAGVGTRLDVAPANRRQQSPRLDELVATTLARPLFSSTRRPPQNASASAATDSDLADTRLTGIITEPGRRIAIFAVSGDKPLRVSEGEAVSGWRIESITPREVSLSGPTGTKTLQPKFDANLVPVPGQVPAGNAGGRGPTPPAVAGARPPVPPATAGVGQGRPTVPVNSTGTPPRVPRVRQQR